jgi:imidazolonepropionase-like amidohydrolase/Tol biopolymer transport system component
MKRSIILALALCSGLGLHAQNKEKKKEWDVTNPPGPFKEVEFTTSEGTWMSLDVSPDGKDIVFDLLGDIYIMPVGGGNATPVLTGHAWEVQPRFSPDGKKISYTSDKGGGDNIWIANRDGSDAKQVTKENFRLLNNAVWTPDGNYLIARKHFTSGRSLGAGELWMYHFSGGEGIQLTKKKNDQQDAGEPSISPDGRYVYYSEDIYPGGYFQYNKDPNSQIYVIRRFDRVEGKIEDVTGGAGGAVRPQISRDGKLLAFVKRVREKTVLYLRDIESGEEWPVFDRLSKDQQEAWAIFGVYSNFSWMPDNKRIIIWAEGKIWNLDITTSKATEIPFTAKCKHKIADAVKFNPEVAPDKFEAKVVRQLVTSPDGKSVIFNAAGYLWKKDLPNGTPARLTSGTEFEFEPSFSTDGKEIVYVTWSDEETGSICRINVAAKGSKPVKLTKEKGIFRTPRFSPDGKWIVYQKEEGNNHQGYNYSVKPGIYVIQSGGSNPVLVTKDGFEPRFNKDGKRVFFITEGAEKAFKSITVDGKEERTHFTSKYTNAFVPSPDNNWIAFAELYKVYIAPMPETGKTMDLGAKIGSVPVSQVARDAGINLHWSNDGKKLHWTLGDEYFTNEVKNRFTFLEGSPDTLPPIDTVGVKIGLVLNSDKPKGVLALKGARIITMKGDEVIENGTIIITDNRITEIGSSSSVQVPNGAKVIDVTGKTIMPGFVDVHAHLGTFRQGLTPQKQWSYFANLAYGVTTTHDPSSNSEMVFSQSEAVKAGHMIGPRIFSTGTILYGADGDFKAVINNLEDARSSIRRTKAYGAFSVKSYNQPRREQRQQVITAARELRIMVVPEGGSFFQHNMSMIIDGHTGIEHNTPVAPLFNDVIQLWSASKTAYTPTLIVTYGGVNGEYYWYQKTNVWEKTRLLNFTPRSVIDSRARHRTMIPEEEYINGHILVSKSCKKLADAGVKVNLGSHGQIQGIGAHWELWMLQQGGMSNMQALRCATMNGAEYIGMEKEIGSLEKGKLADLIVMDKNPLESIQNTETIKYTMINGRLYDAETMNEIGNYDRKRTKFWWEGGKSAGPFNWHEETQGEGCGNGACQH